MRRLARRLAVLVPVVALAFLAGFVCAHVVPVAQAAALPLTPQIIDVGALSDDEIGPIRPGTALRSKVLVSADGSTVAVQEGTIPKHFHAAANEIQYIIEGSGKFWLGDKIQDVHAGDLIVIPKGTAHAGATIVSGNLRAIAIKTPPQDPTDTHFLP